MRSGNETIAVDPHVACVFGIGVAERSLETNPKYLVLAEPIRRIGAGRAKPVCEPIANQADLVRRIDMIRPRIFEEVVVTPPCAECCVTTVVFFSVATQEVFLGAGKEKREKRQRKEPRSPVTLALMKTLYPQSIIAQNLPRGKQVFGHVPKAAERGVRSERSAQENLALAGSRGRCRRGGTGRFSLGWVL